MALLTDGAFLVRHPLFPESRCARAISLAREFFALPDCQKQALAIEQSPHFRGYSVMHNPRDWREQLHLGREEPADPSHQLRGPNLWPESAEWKSEIIRLMEDLERAARDVLGELAISLGAPSFVRDDELPYLVMKLIHYQELPNGELRSGVAPHVDFSWITLLLQDDTGGLEVRTRDGEWMPIEPTPGTLVVNFGEILEFATRGYYAATPHRVVSGSRSRVSIPFFLNPGLETWVEPVTDHKRRWSVPQEFQDSTHVHRVFSARRDAAFIYGDEERKRKGLGVYCESCFQQSGR
jgi:isopenicillin N synthase-like dioxygenase